jgi:hypothetical protein
MSQHVQNKGQVGPVTKGSAAGTGVAGAGAVVIVWIASIFGFEIPAEVASAIVIIIGFIGSLVGGKVVSPEKAAAFQRDRGQPVD